IGNFPFYLPSGSSGTTVATTGSIYANILSELGIVGVMLFSGFVGSIIFGLVGVLRRRRDPEVVALAFPTMVSIVGVMINHIALSGLYTDSYLWAVWAIGAAVVRLDSRSRQAARREGPDEDAGVSAAEGGSGGRTVPAVGGAG
ncbi:MAG: hypothetical protein AAB254_09135, partial [candidate division NC10 bacterium]